MKVGAPAATLGEKREVMSSAVEAFLVISDPSMNSCDLAMPTSMLPVHEIKYTSDLF